jgi:hypothetical protein
MKGLLSILMFFLSLQLVAQQGVYNQKSELLFVIENGRISAPESDVILTVRGNIIFFGTSNKADDILFNTDAKSVFQKIGAMCTKKIQDKPNGLSAKATSTTKVLSPKI